MARVLIVDDALMMRKMIGKILESAGHIIVGEASNGAQGIEMYQSTLPDIVTMDITMPGTDGIQALAQIMAMNKNAKVIMISALGQQHKVMEALDHGAKSYILKPITEKKILAVVQQVMERESCPILADKSVFECGEGRNQQNCDRLFEHERGAGSTPFTVDNKEGRFLFTIKNEFACEDFSTLMKTVHEMLLLHPLEIVFNFIHNDVVNNRVVSSFIDVMTTILNQESRLQVICYNQDYMRFFRNVPILKRVDFTLVKKVD